MIRPTTHYTLCCDGCPVILNSAGLTLRAVQEVGANRGWLSLGGRDLCPRCQIASYDDPEAADADPVLVGHYRCVGGDDPASSGMVPLLGDLGRATAVEAGPGAAAATDLFTAGQAWFEPRHSLDARFCGCSSFWQRVVQSGRTVFASWIR